MSRFKRTLRRNHVLHKLSRARRSTRNARGSYERGYTSRKLVTAKDNDQFIGENAVFHLKLVHGLAQQSSDASGFVSISGFFSPDSLPGWASFGTLFKYFRPKSAVLSVIPHRGQDHDGLISIRVSSDPSDSIESTIAEEVERGAKLYPIATLPSEGIKVDLLSVGPEHDSSVSEWKDWHATTPFGDAKEYGQVFIRGTSFPVSTNAFHVSTMTEISFKSLKNI